MRPGALALAFPSDTQYVVGTIHTQIVEGFWSLVRRGVVGTFQGLRRASPALRRRVYVPL